MTVPFTFLLLLKCKRIYIREIIEKNYLKIELLYIKKLSKCRDTYYIDQIIIE